MTKHNIDPFDKYKKEYWKASKERKGEIIKTVVELTQMHKKSVIRKFKKLQIKDPVVSDRRGRPCYYTNDVISALKDVWEVSGRLCAELMHPVVSMYIEELEEKNKWHNSSSPPYSLS